jgi:hypothetical protein
MGKEVSDVADKSAKLPNLFCALRSWPVHDMVCFLAVSFDPSCRDMVPKKIDFHLEEMCFSQVTVKLSFSQHAKYRLDIFAMFIEGVGPDNDVIQIDVTDLPNPRPKCSHNSSLVDGWRVFQAHRHHCPLKEPKWCKHCSKWDIRWLHPCLEETVRHINGSPNPTFCTIIKNIVNPRQGMRIRDGVLVELSIIVNPTWEDRRIRLRNNKCR